MINELNLQDGAVGTAAEGKKDHALASAATVPDVRRFKLSQIRVGDNAREDFDAEEMRRLVESMRQSREKIGSTLQPLLGVLKADGTVELIAGERRFRAAPEAGYEEMEVKVLTEVKTRDVLIWNLTENTIRANLKPTEKAKRVVALLAMTEDSRPVFSRASLAEELGEDANSIDHCVNLMKAPENVRAEIDAGTSLEIGGMIGALPPEQQTDAANAILFSSMGAMGVMAARDYIAEHCRRDLRKAQWSKEDADLVPSAGACTKCPQWGGEHAAITGKNRVHVCLNPRCFSEKTRAFQLKVEARAEDEKTKVLHESSKYFKSENNEVKPDCGYIDLRDKPDAYLIEGGRTTGTPTWDKILKDSGVPQVIAFDHQGRARNLVESALAITAAKLSPHANLFKAAAGDGVKTQEEKKSDGKVAKAQKAATTRVLRDACIELLQGIGSAWSWQMLFELWWSIVTTGGHQREDGEMLLSVLDPNAKPSGDLWEQLAEQVRDKLKTEEQLGAFVMLSRNIRGIRYNGLSHIEHSMAEVCDLAEFDAGKWRGTLEAEVKQAGKKDGETRRHGDKEKPGSIKLSSLKGEEREFGEHLVNDPVIASKPNENQVLKCCCAAGMKVEKTGRVAVEWGVDASGQWYSGYSLKLPGKAKRSELGCATPCNEIYATRGEAIMTALLQVRDKLASKAADSTEGEAAVQRVYLALKAAMKWGPREGPRYVQGNPKPKAKKCIHELPIEACGFCRDGPARMTNKKCGILDIQKKVKPKKPHGGVPEVDPKVKAKARKLYDAGKGKDAIAKDLGISANTVGNWQKREWPKRKK